MSNKVCPKTCSQLSTAAVFMAVGVVQLLAGIILLKSQYVSLLAGADFIAAASNVVIGGLLGILASTWAKKRKWISVKNTARQNVLAGLYISVISLNATAAIVMVMGDGNKLLTVPVEMNLNAPASFVSEILACAYVTSVCSPIVCIVIAIVSLSGNCIQAHDKIMKRAKQKNSFSENDSFGWVFETNIGKRSSLLSEDIPFSPTSSVMDDNVFMSRQASKESSRKKAVPSYKNLKSPMEIWAHKRKKILEELASPQQFVFTGDYLRFPDYSYGSYAETLIPRIKPSSIVRTKNQNSQARDLLSPNPRLSEASRTTSCEDSSSATERDLKQVDTVKSYIDVVVHKETGENEFEQVSTMNTNNLLAEIVKELPLDVSQSLLDGVNEGPNSYSQTFDSQRSTRANSSKIDTNPQSMEEDLVANQSSLFIHKSEGIRNKLKKQIAVSTEDIAGSLDIENHGFRENKITVETTTPKVQSDMIDQMKLNITINPFDGKTTCEEKREFLKSFKNQRKRLSEPGLDKLSSVVGESFEGTADASTLCETDVPKSKSSWAGEIVQISVCRSGLTRTNSTPVFNTVIQSPNYQSLKLIKDMSSKTLDHEKGEIRNPVLKEVLLQHNSASASSINQNDANKKTLKQVILEYPKITSIKQSNIKRNLVKRVSSMGSIEESPSEETSQDVDVSVQCDAELKPARIVEPKELTDENANVKPVDQTIFSSWGSPKNLLKRIWASPSSGSKTNLANLIMDGDSLVGLTEDELLVRTNRIRVLRKNVEQRLKNQDLVSRINEEEIN